MVGTVILLLLLFKKKLRSKHIKISEKIIIKKSNETPAHLDAVSYYIWLQKVERFGKYRLDKVRANGQKGRQTD